MIKNYFKLAFRNLQKNRLYSFINIAGFSVGIASCLLIFLYVSHELSYDSYHKNAGSIYRLSAILHLPKEDNSRAVTSPPIAPILQASLPEIKKAVRINYSARTISHNDTKLFDAKVIYADSTLFDIFSFPMINGDPHTALVNPFSIVLTETAVKKYFGNEQAMGKTMKLSDTINLTVTGIIRDIPENSHFSFDCALSRTSISAMSNNRPEDNFYNNNYYTYLLLPDNYPYHTLEPKIKSIVSKAMMEQRKEMGLSYDFKLQPLTDIHLRSNLNSEINPNSDISYVYIFMVTALLILLIACSNFVNLSTARSVNRAKEIGLRKVIGAKRVQLIFQFFSESFLFALIAGVLAIILVSITLPWFNRFTGLPLSLGSIAGAGAVFVYFGIIVAIGMVAGIYPALQLSSFGPVRALKGNVKYEWQDIFLRKGLVVFQFSIAVFLIAVTALVFQQLRFMQNKKIGLNKDQVIEIPITNKDLSKSATIIKELENNPGVVSATITDFSFKEGIGSIAMLPEGASENEVTSENVITVDENFIPTFQVQMAAGRNFSKSFTTDPEAAFIVNETAVQKFGWGTPSEAIGKNINWGLGKKGKVIGVVKNFNVSSLHAAIKPLIIHILPDWYKYIAVRIKAENISATIGSIGSNWKPIAVNSPFIYSFMDNDFANLYQGEQKMQSILGLFSILAVLISCLGLFGLAAFTIKQRFKEIGVRKVLGASSKSIIGLLSKDFLKLVVIAVVVGSAITYFSIFKWLQGFAYHIDISALVFLATGLLAIIIAFMTIGFMALKASMMNPVKSIRAEG